MPQSIAWSTSRRDSAASTLPHQSRPSVHAPKPTSETDTPDDPRLRLGMLLGTTPRFYPHRSRSSPSRFALREGRPVRTLSKIVCACAVLACVLALAPVASASNDYYFNQLWGLRKIGGDKAWATGTGAGV